jgi:allophanate hydrolase subunit 2
MEETNSINIKQEDLKILAQVNPGAWIQLENIVLKRQQQELMNQIKIMGTEKIKESKNGVVETKEKVK